MENLQEFFTNNFALFLSPSEVEELIKIKGLLSEGIQRKLVKFNFTGNPVSISKPLEVKPAVSEVKQELKEGSLLSNIVKRLEISKEDIKEEQKEEKKLEWKEVTSTNLKKVGYNEITQELFVEFSNNGAKYKYFPVSSKVYGELLEAESTGKFFNDAIRKNNDIKYIKIS